MADEIKNETNELEQNYLNKINEMKQQMSQMVSKEKYNKAIEDQAKLLDAYTTGKTVSGKDEDEKLFEDPQKVIDDVVKKQSAKVLLFNDLEAFKDTDNYVKAVEQKYGVNPLITRGSKLVNRNGKIVPTGEKHNDPESVRTAAMVAKFIECAASCKDQDELELFMKQHLTEGESDYYGDDSELGL